MCVFEERTCSQDEDRVKTALPSDVFYIPWRCQQPKKDRKGKKRPLLTCVTTLSSLTSNTYNKVVYSYIAKWTTMFEYYNISQHHSFTLSLSYILHTYAIYGLLHFNAMNMIIYHIISICLNLLLSFFNGSFEPLSLFTITIKLDIMEPLRLREH